MSALFERGNAYQQGRPDYPPALFQWLAEHSPCHQRALDMGCGSGQASRALEPFFKQVIGADISLGQLQGAPASASHYLACRADRLPLAARSLDLIVAAQAFHWFAQDGFFDEAGRTLKPGGLLALVSYGICQVEGLGNLISNFHDHALGPWWPPERAQVVAGYPGASPGWPTVPCPDSTIERHWQARDMLAYLDTWSALVQARRAGQQPLAAFSSTLRKAWGPGRRQVRWPLRVRAWRR